MTGPELNLLQTFLRQFNERCDGIEEKIDDLGVRIARLEQRADRSDGRNGFIAVVAKTVGGLLAAALAALGIKSQL